MPVHFQVLASGSSGNCSLLDVDGRGILIDVGVGPRTLASRCRERPPVWDRIGAVLLTHVHGDHWNENSFNQLAKRGIPIHCHPEHAYDLERSSPAFAALIEADLVRRYAIGTLFALTESAHCTPLELNHDGGVTCGFRIEGPERAWSLAYATDLGSWDRPLAQTLADADVVALEFNHDVALQYASGRSPQLIRRVLGDHGHLSNTQAAALFAEVLRHSAPGRVQHLVQLHLSRQCNRPELALRAARAIVRQAGAAVTVHATSQEAGGPRLALGAAPVPLLLFADW